MPHRTAIWPRLRTTLVLAAAVLLAALPAWAATGDPQPLTPRKIFTLLFLMLGPIKILAPFARLTQAAPPALRRRLATRATLFAAAGLTLATLMGRNMLESFNIPVPILAITGGLVLFLTALQTVLEQFSPQPPRTGAPPEVTLAQAISPIAFPIVVTPYGIAAVIIFNALATDDPEARLLIALLVAIILVLDWLAMMFAHTILKYAGTMLQIFAVVLGINQVALGLLVILQNLSKIGVFTMTVP